MPVSYTERKWIVTDPSTSQYGRRISDNIFEFKERVPLKPPGLCKFESDFKHVQKTINLEDFTDTEIERFVSGYYDSLDNLKKQHGNDNNPDWKWIVAECIFEKSQFE